jgi:hypothetical protein
MPSQSCHKQPSCSPIIQETQSCHPIMSPYFLWLTAQRIRTPAALSLINLSSLSMN